MKRKTIVRWISGMAIAGSLATGGVALQSTFAQTPTPATTPTTVPTTPDAQPAPPLPDFDFGRGRGPHGGKLDVVAATVSVTGLTAAQVQTELAAGKTPAQIAEANGKTATDVVNAIVAQRKNALDTAVAAGTISQAQADAELVKATERATTAVNQAGLADEPGHGGPGHGGPGRGGPHQGGRELVATTAEVTGLTEAQVQTELAAGKTLAQVAEANGKTVDDVISALRTKGQAQLDQWLEQAKTQLTTPRTR